MKRQILQQPTIKSNEIHGLMIHIIKYSHAVGLYLFRKIVLKQFMAKYSYCYEIKWIMIRSIPAHSSMTRIFFENCIQRTVLFQELFPMNSSLWGCNNTNTILEYWHWYWYQQNLKEALF